jgi:hypothetical protein
LFRGQAVGLAHDICPVLSEPQMRKNMSVIIKFPKFIHPLRLSPFQHQVRIRIIDPKRPREARWNTQWPIQRAAGFVALKGFDTAAAVNCKWHDFDVKSSRVARLINDTKHLLLAGRIEMKIDGKMIRSSVSAVSAALSMTKRSKSKI